jgi:hypothetical protein
VRSVRIIDGRQLDRGAGPSLAPGTRIRAHAHAGGPLEGQGQ